ncbi:MAG: hypothetical protein Q7V31_12175 [Parvibaculum sp.]|uniref:hypothetical protein n=1 Tax=Parvibaculum sp. TaxID=2024848 RepID=UPI002715C2C5|nr:hypothetical protein [Parvibaculum sp.]MDO8839674.1 hypothetical protein [Parvibaculum sp.]
MSRKSAVVIRMGAAHNSVTVDGVVFDRSTMTRPEQRKLARLVTAAKAIEWGTHAAT